MLVERYQRWKSIWLDKRDSGTAYELKSTMVMAVFKKLEPRRSKRDAYCYKTTHYTCRKTPRLLSLVHHRPQLVPFFSPAWTPSHKRKTCAYPDDHHMDLCAWAHTLSDQTSHHFIACKMGCLHLRWGDVDAMDRRDRWVWFAVLPRLLLRYRRIRLRKYNRSCLQLRLYLRRILFSNGDVFRRLWARRTDL